jgi:hypothetical protein
MADNYNDSQRCTIQANLYILKKIYSNAKRHQSFGKKTFYSIMDISKPRYYRILGGIKFYINKQECKELGEKFGISEKCFTGEKLINLENLKEEHWSAFFKGRNEGELEVKDRNNLSIIKTKIDNVRYNNLLVEYPITSEVYRVMFYFTYGKRIEEEEASLRINRALSELETIAFNEIEKLDTIALNEYKKRLEVQIERLNILIGYKKYKT